MQPIEARHAGHGRHAVGAVGPSCLPVNRSVQRHVHCSRFKGRLASAVASTLATTECCAQQSCVRGLSTASAWLRASRKGARMRLAVGVAHTTPPNARLKPVNLRPRPRPTFDR
eukprot:357744-Chlamydomonas_euryale.AAC.8